MSPDHRRAAHGRATQPPRAAGSAGSAKDFSMSPAADLALAVVSNRGATRWSQGHPWIFRSDVVRFPPSAAGAVRVEDGRGRAIGTALWSPNSEISLRMVDRRPLPALTREWWEERLQLAIARRGEILTRSSACRLVHGEGDGLPSLTCDRYDRWLVVQLMSAGLEAHRQHIVDALRSLTGCEGILARHDGAVREREGLPRETSLLLGDVPQEIEVHEHGVKYLAAPWTGQKTGAFLDQRENRHRIGALARGRALDCFAYHGSFALHLAARADEVVALDVSAAALERARENARLNGRSNISFVEADAFDELRARERAGERFDTIVVDPPAFAKNRPSLAAALRGYHEINLRALRLLAPGGVMFSASCSYHLTKSHFLEMLQGAAADSARRVTLRELCVQPADHPEVITIPETGYLKGAILEAHDT
ncbi:MAG: class I SAM-dependent rRNA methyltransferase [Gemmatimonadaceae bacterium]|nr:class I SAM-dependent rRNA methyltransferase [Gemmatimonadaceae bacterium]